MVSEPPDPRDSALAFRLRLKLHDFHPLETAHPPPSRQMGDHPQDPKHGGHEGEGRGAVVFHVAFEPGYQGVAGVCENRRPAAERGGRGEDVHELEGSGGLECAGGEVGYGGWDA